MTQVFLTSGSTDIDRAFNVKTMAPKLCVPWLLPDHLSQAGCKPVPLDPFAGMWYYDEEVSFHQAEVEGILLIKEQCVYVIRDFGWLFPSIPLEELPDPVRVFVELPRDQTRYDPDTKSIWVHDDGPMVSGDRVEIGGGGFAQALPDACSADVGDIFTATSMQPKRCDPRWPPEHPSQNRLQTHRNPITLLILTLTAAFGCSNDSDLFADSRAAARWAGLGRVRLP